ncbi:MAG: tetratricopeptide repeat protein [Bryobacterales bacterium]|nr:tetratricopeptide repeat protein [Bryobacterales bacterium]
MDALGRMKLMARAMRHAVPGFSRSSNGQDADLRRGEALLAHGSYAEAERYLLQLLDGSGVRKEHQAKLLLSLATARWNLDKRAETRESAIQALERLRDSQPGPDAIACHELLSKVAFFEDDKDSGIRHLVDALKVQEKIKPIDHAALIERNRTIGASWAEREKWDEALQYQNEALRIAERECGGNHKLTADCQNDCGRTLARAGRPEEARELLEKALETHTAVCDTDSEEAASDLQALALLCQAREDWEGAVKFYEQALKVRERQLGGNAGELASLLMSLGGAHYVLGHYGPAVEHLQQAVGRFEGLRDSRLGTALENLGSVYLLCGRVQDAVANFKKARRLWEASPHGKSEHLDSNQKLFEMASDYMPPTEARKLMSSIGVPIEGQTEEAEAPRSYAIPGPRKIKQAPKEPDNDDQRPAPIRPSRPGPANAGAPPAATPVTATDPWQPPPYVALPYAPAPIVPGPFLPGPFLPGPLIPATPVPAGLAQAANSVQPGTLHEVRLHPQPAIGISAMDIAGLQGVVEALTREVEGLEAEIAATCHEQPAAQHAVYGEGRSPAFVPEHLAYGYVAQAPVHSPSVHFPAVTPHSDAGRVVYPVQVNPSYAMTPGPPLRPPQPPPLTVSGPVTLVVGESLRTPAPEAKPPTPTSNVLNGWEDLAFSQVLPPVRVTAARSGS